MSTAFARCWARALPRPLRSWTRTSSVCRRRKCSPAKAEFSPEGYQQYSVQRGRKRAIPGTAVFTRRAPLAVSYGIGKEEHSPRGPRHHAGIPGILSCERLHAQQPERAGAPWLPHAVGGRPARLSVRAGRKKSPWCTAATLNVAHEEIDLKKPEAEPRLRRLFGRGARQADAIAGRGLCGHVPPEIPPAHGRVHLVELLPQGARDERGLAHRLFHRQRARLAQKVRDALIYADVYGSDHCPVGLELAL